MRPDTIDAASELEELQRQAAIQATALTATRYQRLIVTDAVMKSKRRGAGQCQAAGCARTARLTQRSAASINVKLTGPVGPKERIHGKINEGARAGSAATDFPFHDLPEPCPLQHV
jgi:hypothetical protein